MANVEVGKQTITDVTTMTATPTGGSQRTLAAHLATLPDSKITATGATAARTLAERFADTFNLRDFGATGNSEDDATAAMKAAVAAAAALSRPGHVFVPSGYFNITEAIVLPTNVSVRGVGMGSMVNVKSTGAVHAFYVNGGINVHISDLHILSEMVPDTGTANGTSSGRGVYLNGSADCVVRNVWVSGFSGGQYYIENTYDTRLRGCFSDQAYGHGFVIASGSPRTHIVDCVAANFTNGGDGFFLNGAYDVTITGCRVPNGGANGRAGYRINDSLGVKLVGCEAAYTPEDGFMVGDVAACNDIALIGCVGNDNGQKTANTYDSFQLYRCNGADLVGCSGISYAGTTPQRYGFSATANVTRLSVLGGRFVGTSATFSNLSASATLLTPGGRVALTTQDFAALSAGTAVAMSLGAASGNTYGQITVGTGGDAAVGTFKLMPFGGGLEYGTSGSTHAINGAVTTPDLPTYADNAAATAGGLAAGRLYRTATGQVMVRY